MKQLVRPRIALRLIAGLAMTGAAIPAQAQWLAPSSTGFSKTQAILGGAPSSLAAILAAQSGTPSVAATAFGAALSADISLPRRVSPFGFGEAPAPNLAASPDRPDVFNSVALPLSRSPLDDRWSRVGSAGVGGRAAAYATTLRGEVAHARIEAVNAYVNARVSFVDDSRQFGVIDRWSAASDTLARGRGDCEDYALAKLAMLRRAGFADKDLYFVVLKDLTRRADHAVLVVRSEGRFLVLDNGTDRLLDSAEIRDYRPILTFTAGKRYTHGYRRDRVAAPVVMASAASPEIGALASAAGLPSSPFAAR